MYFKDIGVIAPILSALEEKGYVQPTEIQKQAIPVVLSGKDLIGCAQTGTGKTGAFAIPILQFLSKQKEKSFKTRALILVPTRELAIQIDQNISFYAKNLSLSHLAIFGGVPQKKQVDAIRKGVDVLIATPGRLMDLVGQGIVHLDAVKCLVLDEADNMLDMGFIHDIKKILAKIPKNRQSLLFSATMPTAIRKLAADILMNPKEISVTPVSSTVEKINQMVMFMEKKQKPIVLSDLLNQKEYKQTLVFTRTKHGADRLAKSLIKKNVNSVCIHGNKSQNARQKALALFKAGEIPVLIATDIAARGIDIKELPHVINYDLPEDPETYVHRIGRTGRAGKTGHAISFCSPEERQLLQKIEKLIGFKIDSKKEKINNNK